MPCGVEVTTHWAEPHKDQLSEISVRWSLEGWPGQDRATRPCQDFFVLKASLRFAIFVTSTAARRYLAKYHQN